ncbi:DUF6712 family protein [Hymenobacter lapidiphilus]|uniref:Uncharacterized protein n=1 Tax=Hymenobacter lapidiphilus TaxID=2608003 RepID=A0A7Y7PSP3_9BACT|nr:hypothetical protein [Hymenobacter lapidiphilus]NVO33281.1 hypothetical protein [Hymenobacter lapidiphilus]
MLTLTKQDFVDALALSPQVEMNKLAPAIADALRLDVAPRLEAGLLEATRQLSVLPAPADWPLVLADVLPGVLAVRRGRVFTALAPAPDLLSDVPGEAETTAAWRYEPLRTLWLLLLKPYWLAAAYSRFLPTSGFHVDKAGLVVPTDPNGTFQPIGASQRAALQAAADNRRDAYLSDLLRHLRSHHADTERAACGRADSSIHRKIRGV